MVHIAAFILDVFKDHLNNLEHHHHHHCFEALFPDVAVSLFILTMQLNALIITELIKVHEEKQKKLYLRESHI